MLSVQRDTLCSLLPWPSPWPPVLDSPATPVPVVCASLCQPLLLLPAPVMSGLRAARTLRTDAPSGPSSTAAALLAAGEAEMKAHMAKWQGGLAASRKNTALGQHRRAWIKEAQRLSKARKVVEAELAATWNSLAADAQERVPSWVGGEAMQVQQLLRESLSEHAQSVNETRRYAAELSGQVRQAKAMLATMKAQRRTQREAEGTAQAAAAAPPAASRKRHSAVATAAAAAASSQVAAASSAAATAAAASRGAPLSSFLASLTEQLAVQRAAQSTEERALVAELQDMHRGLDEFESPVLEQAIEALEAAEREIAEEREREREQAHALDDEERQEEEEDDQGAAAEEDEPDDDDDELEELEVEEERVRTERLAPEDEADAAEETDSVPVESPPLPSHTFLTHMEVSSPSHAWAASNSTAATPSHRSKRQHQQQPLSTRSSASTSAVPANLIPWPPIPPMDPAVAATLPLAQITSHRQARQSMWDDARDSEMREQIAHESELSQLREALQRDTAAARHTIERADASVRSVWSSDAQARLRHLVTSYRGHGQKYAQLLDRAKLEFAAEAASTKGSMGKASNFASLCLPERIDLLERNRAFAVQKTSLQTAFESDRQNRISRAVAALHEFDRSVVQAFLHAQEVQEHAKAQVERHAELEVLRAERTVREAEQAKQKQEREAMEAAEEAARLEREEQVRQQQKQLLALYHAHLAAEEAEATQAAERVRIAAAEQVRADIEAKKPLVERRQELIAQRRTAAAQREAQEAAAVAAREARLEAIRALVVTTAERDPARLVSATAASAAEDASAHPLFRVDGYDMSALLKDSRFRIHMALAEAGMGNSEYGRQVVMAARPAQAPRGDLASNIFHM